MVEGVSGPIIIEPIDFRATPPPSRGRRRVGRWIWLLFIGVAVGALGVTGWFVLTAADLEVTFDPQPDRVEITGSPLRFRLGERHLLRPGSYTVLAQLEGYHPLREDVEVVRGQANAYHFALEKLPGVVALTCLDAQGAPIDGVEVHVDDARVGRSPLDAIELDSGEYTVTLTHERYQDLQTDITVEGAGIRQELALEMLPDWAQVTLATEPVSARVLIDGEEVASTPCDINVLAGAHTLELQADGYEPWQRELEVIAQLPVSLGTVVLALIPGRVAVDTDPPGASVSIDGSYVGASPIETTVPPGRDVVVRVSHDGYDPASETVRVASQAIESVAFELTLQTGLVRLQIDPPDALLHVDGIEWGEVPSEVTLSALEHELRFSKLGYEAASVTVRPRPDIPDLIALTLTPIEGVSAEDVKEWSAANGYRMVAIPPGSIEIGASRREQGRRTNETLRRVTLRRPFVMGTHEVTNEQFKAFDANHDSGTVKRVSLGGAKRPVVQVTWDDAARFCNWMSERDQLPPAYVEKAGTMSAVKPMTTGYRLPTEAEWEYAARLNGNKAPLKYPWGFQFPPKKKIGNFADDAAADLIVRRIPDYDDAYAGPAPVASYPPNAFGLLDMGGNAAEWCHDFYTIYTYDASSSATDPLGPDSGMHHVVKGSSWRHASITALRFAHRDYSSDKRDDLGFRVCRYLTEPETTDE